MFSVCGALDLSARKAAIVGLICLFCLAVFLAFLPQASFGYFHDEFNSGGKNKNVAGTTTNRPSPKPKGGQSPLFKFFKKKSPKPTPTPAPSRKPVSRAPVQFSIKSWVASVVSFLGLDDIKLSAPKQAVKLSPKPVAKAQVKGTQDKKAGENAIGKFFKSIGRALAAIGDALWPFDGKGKGLADKSKTAAKTSPAPAPTPPAELAKTGDEVAVATATDNATVTVADTVENFTVKGNLTFGDSTADRLKLNGLLESDLLLAANKTYTLGNSGERFKAGYFSDNVFVGDENRIASNGMNTKSSMYLETRSSGSIYLNPDSDNVYVGTSGNTANLTVSNNLRVEGTISTPSGAGLTADSIDITPATNIDALDITGTNITTASLIDLDATASTTGNIIDIDTSTTHSGHVISIDNTGNNVWTGNIIDVATGTGDAAGDVIKIAIEAGATDVQGIVVTNAAATDQAGWLASVNASAAWTANAINFLQSAGISTADVIAYDNTGNTATTGDFISFASGTGDADGDVMDITVELGATSTQIFDVNNAAVSDEAGWLLEVDTTGAWTGNAIDFTTGAQAWTGNVIGVTVGAAASTGDILNVSMGSSNLAGGVLVIADAGGARSDALIDITTASTGSAADAAAIFQINSTGVLNASANVLDINMSGGAASNVVDITTLTTAFTGNLVDLNFGNIADTGAGVDISMGAAAVDAQGLVISTSAGIRTSSAIQVTENNTSGTVATFNIDSSATRGGLFDIDTTGIWTDEHLIDITTGAQAWTANILDVNVGAAASTGDVFNVDMGSSNIAGGAFVVAAAGGARSDALIDITTASTGSAADAAAIFQINSTGVLNASANVLDINMSGGAASNVVDITTLTTAFTGNLVDLNFGNIADTGDAINIGHGASAVGIQAMVVGLTAGGLTSTDGIFDIDLTAGNAAVDGINLALTQNDGATAGTDATAVEILLTGNDADGDMFGMTITGAATTNAGAGTYEALLTLTNNENTAGAVTNAIIITSGAATAGSITNGINFDTTDVTTEIVLQNDETIDNNTDDSIVLTGVGGTNNETFTIDLDSVASSGATLSSGGTFVLVNDNLSVGIDGNTTENIASSDFAFSGNDLYVDDKFGVNGTASIDGNLWQGDGVTTTTKTTAFLFLGTTAGAPTGDPATPAGFAAIVWDTTNNKICADEEAAGGTWLCTAALTDIAEWMPAAGAESGDLVSVTNLPNPTVDPTAPFMLGKTTKAYDNKLVGVVSKYAEDAGSAQGYKLSPDYHAVTLVGRVPVKVSGENGPIAKGDYLTSSSIPGHAMKATKAGPVAGMALEAFSGDRGTIMLFVKAAWFDPVEEQKRAVLAALGLGSGSVLGASTTATGSVDGQTATATNPLVGAASDGSLGVLAEEVDLLVHGLLTANNLRVTTAAEFAGTLVVKGLATFEGNVVVKGELATGSLDISGALTKTMTAGSDLAAGDPVVVSGANTVARAGGPSANVVGLAATSAGAGGSVKVAVAGTVGGYSGLATGARYYVGGGGVVTTAPGGDRAVHIGIAISGSEMIVQIFESVAPPAPPVVDTATVDTGPTLTVSGGSSSGGSSSSEPTSSPTTEPTPAPSPKPLPSSGPSASPVPSPEPTVAPEASPAPSPGPSAEPSPTP